ncbi:hypothetical protein E4O03_11720 [Treponema sp. OMZ 792]|uniref:hypothetical protein n=1 Tax=unclassified Treponema TaxID=2638727 RepID=UPI0020A475F5|nr:MULTISPECIES: hypothetical protein [unclassified Treponema]UTC74848.1 hypothetical protein E4O03_11720 [Treponema sp. OMZ 792]UTC76810.1 hypothetical protein E4O04_01770 [Treponema sp. OMZ 799]UTC81241.1 hypothetical protein E4O07_11630 [Treponema sp. OMZ 798]
MKLPLGVTQDTLNICKDIVSKYTEEKDIDEVALDLLNLVYSKGGDFSEKTLQMFAKAYFKKGVY